MGLSVTNLNEIFYFLIKYSFYQTSNYKGESLLEKKKKSFKKQNIQLRLVTGRHIIVLCQT